MFEQIVHVIDIKCWLVALLFIYHLTLFLERSTNQSIACLPHIDKKSETFSCRSFFNIAPLTYVLDYRWHVLYLLAFRLIDTGKYRCYIDMPAKIGVWLYIFKFLFWFFQRPSNIYGSILRRWTSQNFRTARSICIAMSFSSYLSFISLVMQPWGFFDE